MSEALQRNEIIASTRLQNALVAYQVAIDLWAHAGEEVWDRFNVMLVANSIIIAVIGLAITGQRALPAITVLLPLIGIVLCALWFVMMKRGFDYQVYFILSARELEEKYLADPVSVLSRGAVFANGKAISLEVAGGSTTHRMSLWSRLMTAQRASYAVIIVFVVVYVAMLLQI